MVHALARGCVALSLLLVSAQAAVLPPVRVVLEQAELRAASEQACRRDALRGLAGGVPGRVRARPAPRGHRIGRRELFVRVHAAVALE